MATVNDLIAKLKSFPGDAEVIINSDSAEMFVKLDLPTMVEYFDFTGWADRDMPTDVKDALGSRSKARKIVYIES